jgi:hypothetical protein
VKWYFAINEAGALGEVGWHARLAVLSALQRTSLDPVLLHTGAPGSLTEWMESHGVRVLNVHRHSNDRSPSWRSAGDTAPHSLDTGSAR